MQYEQHALHSQYDPQKEAFRFLQAELSNHNPDLIIIFGEVLGYISEAARKLCPSAVIIALYPTEQLLEHRISTRNIIHTALCDPHTLHEFFLFHINESLILNMRIVQWRPSLHYFAASITQQQNILKKTVKELNANIQTVSYFGKRWIRNTFRNYLYINTRLILKKQTPLTVITAAGPSLNQSIPLLKKYRPFIMATSSSLETLYAHDIIPQLIIHTDGGTWAKRHLDKARQTIAMPLTAALPLPGIHEALVFSQGSLPEKEIPETRHWIRIAEHATVAGSALFLAQGFTEGSILYAGMDLAPAEGRTHSRPHTWDRVLSTNASFLCTEETTYYQRLYAPLTEKNNALQQYRQWFSSFSFAKKVFCLTRTLAPFPLADENMLKTSAASDISFLRLPLPSLEERRTLLLTICKRWEKTTDLSEFIPLLSYISPEMWKDMGRKEKKERNITPAHREVVRDFLSTLRRSLQ